MKQLLSIIITIIALVIFFGKDYVCFTIESGVNDKATDFIRVPDGFKVSVFADNIKGVRALTMGDKGTIFAGTRDEGKVYAIKDINGDYKSDKVIVIADNLNMPNGVAFLNGSLYVAEISRIIRADNIETTPADHLKWVTVNDSFPRDRSHGWKYIAFGPDRKLYVPVGAPCNICESKDKRYATIMRMNPDGSGLEIFANGIRNSVGFDWDPAGSGMWFTDNGRDWLGNDLPPDELNHAPVQNLHFGYPYCHGTDISDPEFGNDKDCSKYKPPAVELDAHVASLGMKFYTGKQFPAIYRNSIFIAEHGSWNRNPPSGYRISLVTVRDGKAVSYKIFASGWLDGLRVKGRPVDILILPDGSMLVSDDMKGVIYRIFYRTR